MIKTNWITVAVITLFVFLVVMFGAMILGMGSYQDVGPVWMRGNMTFRWTDDDGHVLDSDCFYRLGCIGRFPALAG